MSIIERIMREEGYRQFVYTCPAGKLSCGFGRNLEDKGITQPEAEFLLWNDVKEAEEDVKVLIPHPHETLTLNRREALVDMRFQLGGVGFRRFERMLDAVRFGDWETAARELLDSLYATQVPNRAKRNAELLRLG